MSTTDYGARDSAVRTQTYSLVQRLAGLPQPLFVQYWRDVHAPLCSRLPGLGFYVQHHFSREHSSNLWPVPAGVSRIDMVLDGMVEIGFASEDEAGKFVAASPLLFGDEVNCFGWDAAFFLPDGSKTYVDQDPDGTPNGPDRWHRLHLYLNGEDTTAFSSFIDRFAAALHATGKLMKLRVHKPLTFDNANPAPPSPVPHFVPENMLHIAVLEIGFPSAVDARLFTESDAYTKASADLPQFVRAMNAYLVTHVFTFVRDGKLTMAGLRGSSVAEAISRIGASNHAAEDVTRLFIRD